MSPTTRMTAEERREIILEHAVVEFARMGLHGASTVTIAQAANVSQPYLFRLFGTKQKLFLAAVERVFNKIVAEFRAAGSEGEPAARIHSMGQAYRHLLQRRHELLLILQSFTASDDLEIQTFVRSRYQGLYQLVVDLSGADPQAVQAFMAKGALLTMAAAIQLPDLAPEAEWVQRLLD